MAKAFFHLELYIFPFLHQTTTKCAVYRYRECCISFLFYIKPQRPEHALAWHLGCISFLFYIKPQLRLFICNFAAVVYLSFSTSNHNLSSRCRTSPSVVYLSFSTSNHNSLRRRTWFAALYIFPFLHQTTTIGNAVSALQVVYLSFSTSNHNRRGAYMLRLQVVYLSFSTSNHNKPGA